MDGGQRRRSGQSRWTPEKAARRKVQRWRQKAKVARATAATNAGGVAKQHQAIKAVLQGLVTFKQEARRDAKAPLNWPTMLRIATAPASVGAQALSSLAFGGSISVSTIRRTRIRLAAALLRASSRRIQTILSTFSFPLEQPGEGEFLLLAQLWKFDDTEVRWRTYQANASKGSYGTTCLVQRGFLVARTESSVRRYALATPPIPLPSHSASDLWVNLACPLSSSTPLSSRAVSLMMYTCDAAASNRSCLAREVALCSSEDGPLRLIWHAPCLAHQVHLSSRTQYLGMPPSFITDLSRCAHVLQVGRYFSNLVEEALTFVSESLAILPREVDDLVPDSNARQHLLMHLVSSSRGGLPRKVKAAICTTVQILNGDWTRPVPEHICTGCCSGRAETVARLLPALRELLALQPPVASSARWTDTYRSVCTISIWLLLHRLGFSALLRLPQVQALTRAKPKGRSRMPGPPHVPVEDAGADADGEAAESELSFTELLNRRLGFVRQWWGQPETLGRLLMLVACNFPLRRLLLWSFAQQSRVNPDVRAYARRSGAPVVAEKTPAPLVLARGEYVGRLLCEAATLLHRSLDCAMPPWLHCAWAVASSCLHGAQVLAHRVLIPGLAQMWYRTQLVYTAWPWPLLRLVDDTTLPQTRESIALGFLSAPVCCLSPSFCRPLRLFLTGSREAVAGYEKFVDQLAHPTGVLKAILQTVVEDYEVTVVDIECRHARHRRSVVGGRPPNFSTVAARCYVRECETLHSQCADGTPQPHLQQLLLQAQQLLTEPAKRLSRKAAHANPFLAYRKHREQLHHTARSAGQQLSPHKPRSAEWENEVGHEFRALLPEERLHWQLRAIEDKKRKQSQLEGPAVAPASLSSGAATTTVAKIGKANVHCLTGDKSCFLSMEEMALALQDPNPGSLTSTGKDLALTSQAPLIPAAPGSPPPAPTSVSSRRSSLARMEDDWKSLNAPFGATADVKCFPWYRTCKERGICDASPLATVVHELQAELFAKAKLHPATPGVTVWCIQPTTAQHLMDSTTLIFLVAHILWNPRRMVAIRLSPPGTPGQREPPWEVSMRRAPDGGLQFALLEELLLGHLQATGTAPQQLHILQTTIRAECCCCILGASHTYQLSAVKPAAPVQSIKSWIGTQGLALTDLFSLSATPKAAASRKAAGVGQQGTGLRIRRPGRRAAAPDRLASHDGVQAVQEDRFTQLCCEHNGCCICNAMMLMIEDNECVC